MSKPCAGFDALVGDVVPLAVPRTRPATAFAGCEGGGCAGSTGILGGDGVESDGEIVDVEVVGI